MVEICGRTLLPVNTVHIRIRNEQGKEITTAAEYRGGAEGTQCFRAEVPEGNCTVSFVFLPGSSFDFHTYRFYRENWTDNEE